MKNINNYIIEKLKINKNCNLDNEFTVLEQLVSNLMFEAGWWKSEFTINSNKNDYITTISFSVNPTHKDFIETLGFLKRNLDKNISITFDFKKREIYITQ